MNLVKFWQDQVDKWDDENKCGFCWEFSAPLIESSIQLVEPEAGKECCVKVMFLQDKQPAFVASNLYSEQTGLMNLQTCTYNFQLIVVIDSVLGVQNYNEIKNHDTDQSKWAEIYSRLQECLMCDINLDFCELIGNSYRVTNWSATQVINLTGSNYCGYRINVSFQKSN